jgi:hypothetical protein
MINILCFVFCLTAQRIGKEIIILEPLTEVSAKDLIYFGTNSGIAVFNKDSKTWSRISSVSGLPDNKIRIIGIDEGIIWVVTETGIASADIKLNDWQIHNFTEPITGLTFDEDCVWIAGIFGVKAMDKYTEKWLEITQNKTNSILSENKVIWMGTDNGIYKFDRRFERLEKVQEVPDISITSMINTPTNIWFLSKDEFVSYNKKNNLWSKYPGYSIDDYQILGDSIFILSAGKIIYFEPLTSMWYEYKESGDIAGITGFTINSQNLLFATNNGLYIFDLTAKSRTVYNKKNGLLQDTLFDVYENNDFIFVINDYSIQYFDKKNKIWGIEELYAPIKKEKKLFYYDDSGLHNNLVNDIDIRLQGRTYYNQYVKLYNGEPEYTSFESVNLKLIGEHKSNRLISLYYDDTDKDQILYGFGYRGLENDFFYRINAGYIPLDFYELDLIPHFSTLGGDAKFKMKNHQLNIAGGQIKSQIRSEFFYGRTYQITDTIFDLEYANNVFYYIFSRPQKIDKGIDTIFIDDQIQSNNGYDTRVNWTIGGITGDFDPLINGVDYMLDYNQGIIQFLSPRDSDDIIILLYNGNAYIIQADSINNAIENTYLLGNDIIPHTFDLKIIDTAGLVHPLADFGIDNNRDNRVDPEFINYKLGFLRFPSLRPFPREVYDDSVHIYSLLFTYHSYTTFYKLSYRPVLINSEKVFVDGQLMARGIDYIIDYTSGRVIFIKEGLVTDLSEVEIKYMSVQREGKEMYFGFQPNISVNNAINVAPGIGVVQDENLFFCTAQLAKDFSWNRSIKLIPQFSINQDREYAQDYELIANYGILSMNGNYTSFTDNYNAFGMNRKKYGNLSNGGKLDIMLEPATHLRLSGSFIQEYQKDSLKNQYQTCYQFVKIHYLNPRLPNGYLLLGRDLVPEYNSKKVQIYLNHNSEFNNINLKLNGLTHTNWQISRDNKSHKLYEYYIGSNLALPIPVNFDLRLFNTNLYQNIIKEKQENKLRTIINIDFIPGINYVLHYELIKDRFYYEGSNDLSLENFYNNTIFFAPGRWFQRFNFLNWGIGFGQNFNEYLSNLSAPYNPLILTKPFYSNAISTCNHSQNMYLTIQIIPYSKVYIWIKESLIKSGYSYYTLPDLQNKYIDEIRIEYEPENLGLWTIYYMRNRTYSYPAEHLQNLYLEWNKPWSSLLRTKIYSNLQYGKDIYGQLSFSNSGIKINSEALFRISKNNFWALNFGWTKEIRYDSGEKYSTIMGTGCNLNLMSFIYFQANYEAVDIFQGTPIHNLAAKFIGQF